MADKQVYHRLYNADDQPIIIKNLKDVNFRYKMRVKYFALHLYVFDLKEEVAKKLFDVISKEVEEIELELQFNLDKIKSI